MHSEWVEAMENMHNYIYLTHNRIGKWRHETCGSFCAGIEYDVYSRVLNLCKVT